MRREIAKYGGNPPPETKLVIGEVGGILVPICMTLSPCSFFPAHSHSPLLAGLHDLSLRTLGRSDNRLHTFRNRHLFRLHVRLHLPRHRLPTNSSIGNGVKFGSTFVIRCSLSTVRRCNVSEIGYSGSYSFVGWVDDTYGSATVYLPENWT